MYDLLVIYTIHVHVIDYLHNDVQITFYLYIQCMDTKLFVQQCKYIELFAQPENKFKNPHFPPLNNVVTCHLLSGFQTLCLAS